MSAAKPAIITQLKADATIPSLVSDRIFPEMPPEGLATYPLITVTAQKAAKPERVFQGIAFEDSVWLVRACEQSTSPAKVAEINTAIRAALDGATLTLDTYESVNCEWLGDYETHEVYNGQIYQYEGGFYRVWITAT